MHRERARGRQPILLREPRRDEFQQQCWLPERAGMLQVLERERCRQARGGARAPRRALPTLKQARDPQLIHDHGTRERNHQQ